MRIFVVCFWICWHFPVRSCFCSMGSWLATCPDRNWWLLPTCKVPLGSRSLICIVEHCTNIFTPSFAWPQHHTRVSQVLHNIPSRKHSINLMIALENIIKNIFRMGGVAKVQEMITGKNWKWVSSTANAGALEKEEFHPAPAHSQVVIPMSGQHTLHRQSGDQLKVQSRNHAGQSEETGPSKVQHASLETIIRHFLEPGQNQSNMEWICLVSMSPSYGHNFLYFKLGQSEICFVLQARIPCTY